MPQLYRVVLVNAGRNKISVIKELRELLHLDLTRAKILTDAPDTEIATGVDEAQAQQMAAQLEKAGATVEVRFA